MFGDSRIPLYVLNVTYPLIDAEFVRFCAGKSAILIIEEGQPEFIEQAVNTILRRADIQTRDRGQGHAADGGRIYRRRDEATGLRKFVARLSAGPAARRAAPAAVARRDDRLASAQQAVARQGARPPAVVLHRLPGTADLRRHEAGRARARRRIT